MPCACASRRNFRRARCAERQDRPRRSVDRARRDLRPAGEGRRENQARRRSLPVAQGVQESGRDRRHAQGAYPRRRGADEIPRLVCARGAERRSHRNRRGRNAGRLSAARPARCAISLSIPFPGRARTARWCIIASRASTNRPVRQQRDVPDRFRRAISRRHDRRDAHADRGHADARKCTTASRAC